MGRSSCGRGSGETWRTEVLGSSKADWQILVRCRCEHWAPVGIINNHRHRRHHSACNNATAPGVKRMLQFMVLRDALLDFSEARSIRMIECRRRVHRQHHGQNSDQDGNEAATKCWCHIQCEPERQRACTLAYCRIRQQCGYEGLKTKPCQRTMPASVNGPRSRPHPRSRP